MLQLPFTNDEGERFTFNLDPNTVECVMEREERGERTDPDGNLVEIRRTRTAIFFIGRESQTAATIANADEVAAEIARLKFEGSGGRVHTPTFTEYENRVTILKTAEEIVAENIDAAQAKLETLRGDLLDAEEAGNEVAVTRINETIADVESKIAELEGAPSVGNAAE